MVIDPKGELFTSLSEEIERQGYEIVLLDFQNLGKFADKFFITNLRQISFSFIKLSRKTTKLWCCLKLTAKKQSSPFTNGTSIARTVFGQKSLRDNLYNRLIFALYSNIDKTFTKEKYVFANFAYFLSLHNFVKLAQLKFVKIQIIKNYRRFIMKKIAQFISTNPDTLTSILVNAYGAISKFNSIGLKMFSSKDQTNFDELVQQSDPDFKEKFNSNIKPFAVFITFQLDSNIGQLMIPSIINNCYSSLISIANSKPNRRNFRDFLFLGDEFGIYLRFTKWDENVNRCILWHLLCVGFAKNIQQLAKYGKENDTILSNSALKIYFRSNDIKSIETFVKFAGKKDVIKKSYSNSEKAEKSNQTSNSETVS
ncbi:type IV secretory system conjugative DNA transfer family protein [Mesomycoplasma ovipneumoniae]|uniref:type IV secretory system conjugative DNA transfer family protein n=1 Tax=Mesomycoplasma ovipneumoniae TaxID=29562 RepID=UPI0028A5F2F6|nr:type IV secretory system conjugative DNA transfer family protein [Mesomycoplasma ovipneumoniae]WNM15361.1 type IV secretory system conjugative DNA transfer family protein [Mesomycoplasma ovipneumoniae]